VAASEKRTFSLPAEQGAFIDQLVESGAYATGSEVIRAGLRALQERDAAVERWLREDVAQAYDRMEADPGRAIPLADVRRLMREHHGARTKGDR
jgi:antitoxin ParD1/3/4